MTRTPQLIFQVACQCGENVHKFSNYHAAIQERDRLRIVRLQETEDACECLGSAWAVDWHTEWLPDPIATVRQAHPYAYCRPPLAAGIPWAVMHHPADHFCGAPIAEGPTEAAAWLAAAERVCA